MRQRSVRCVLLLLSTCAASLGPTSGVDRIVVLDLGENLGPRARARIARHLEPWVIRSHSAKEHAALVAKLAAEALLEGSDRASAPRDLPFLLLSLGNTAAAKRLLGGDVATLTTAEGFAIATHAGAPGVVAIAADGNPMIEETPRSRWNAAAGQLGDAPPSFQASTGAVTAAYAVLESLGFAFLHPLQPVPPLRLRLPAASAAVARRTEGPRWSYRGFHLHTQHPLELTDVLQGFDIAASGTTKSAERAGSWALGADDAGRSGGRRLEDKGPAVAHGLRGGSSRQSYAISPSSEPQGSGDRLSAGTEGVGGRGMSAGSYFESWESMLGDVEAFFEWAAANRVNRVQWMLLGNDRWGEVSASPLRQARLRRLVDLAHSYGLLAGADVPIALRQQHAWLMVGPKGKPAEQQRAIQQRCDWVAEAGFDFISTESGLSEFTDPGGETMLRLLNDFALHVNGTLGLPASVKVHCSTQQLLAEHEDPRWPGEGRPLNFNYLPALAVPQLGILPHTVQAYGLDDPAAGVYGNADFRDVLGYMSWEADRGQRSVVFYGETAYWVSVDVDVPLFLPVYGERRLHDLRVIAAREDGGGGRIDGQMNFHSGMEWGYWLSDIITARAAWNPHTETKDDSAALIALAAPVLSAAFGYETGAALAAWLAGLCETQRELLLLGRTAGEELNSGSGERNLKLTGMAYLSGGDTWLDLPRLLGLPMTQPDKVRFHETSDPLYAGVAPLLAAIVDGLSAHATELDAIVAAYRSDGEHSTGLDLLLEELQDSMAITTLRAKHVQLLYAATGPAAGRGGRSAGQLLRAARSVIAEAQAVVNRREKHYRVPAERVAGWRDGPTVYRYGYLWAVRRLYYWWRDQGVAEGVAGPRAGFCYLNRMDPIEVGFGWGKHAFQAVRAMLSRVLPLQADLLVNCLAPPLEEYEFPRDLDRYSVYLL